MKWVRSWPAHPPPGRAHVADDLPRVVIDDFDYSPLAGLGDLLLLEWDIALSREGMEIFAEHARRTPDRPRVAPYRLYPVSTSEVSPVWAHRQANADGPAPRWLRGGERSAAYVGFGCVYLPAWCVDRFLAADSGTRGRPPYATGPWDPRFTDQAWSMWHAHTIGATVAVDWEVRPVHLHW